MTNVASLWSCHPAQHPQEGECFALPGGGGFTHRITLPMDRTTDCRKDFPGYPEKRNVFWEL